MTTTTTTAPATVEIDGIPFVSYGQPSEPIADVIRDMIATHKVPKDEARSMQRRYFDLIQAYGDDERASYWQSQIDHYQHMIDLHQQAINTLVVIVLRTGVLSQSEVDAALDVKE